MPSVHIHAGGYMSGCTISDLVNEELINSTGEMVTIDYLYHVSIIIQNFLKSCHAEEINAVNKPSNMIVTLFNELVPV